MSQRKISGSITNCTVAGGSKFFWKECLQEEQQNNFSNFNSLKYWSNLLNRPKCTLDILKLRLQAVASQSYMKIICRMVPHRHRVFVGISARRINHKIDLNINWMGISNSQSVVKCSIQLWHLMFVPIFLLISLHTCWHYCSFVIRRIECTIGNCTVTAVFGCYDLNVPCRHAQLANDERAVRQITIT